jgi:cell division protein FtsQ
MRFFIWSNIRLVLIFGVVVFLYSFTTYRNSSRKLIKSEVIFINDDNLFVKEETVNKLLIENKNDVRSIAKDKLDLDKLEKAISKHSMIENADVFVSVNGVLKAVVKQKTPVGRVFDEVGSFYIDYEGNSMPISDSFTARVPLVLGKIDGGNIKKIAEVLKQIYNDEFLKKNIIGVEVLSNGSLNMTNRNFSYQLVFGRPINIEKKFKNYKAFFQKAVLDSSLYKYKKVNLKFTQQVVCTK